jgi:hypothetical protein
VSAENANSPATRRRRQEDLDAGLLGPLQVALAGLDVVGVEQALADLVALGRGR